MVSRHEAWVAGPCLPWLSARGPPAPVRPHYGHWDWAALRRRLPFHLGRLRIGGRKWEWDGACRGVVDASKRYNHIAFWAQLELPLA